MKTCRAELVEHAPHVKGTLRYCVWKLLPNGDIRLLDNVVEHNLVVNSGRQHLAKLISGASTSYINRIAIGPGSDPPQLTDSIEQMTSRGALLFPIISSQVIDTSAVFKWELTSAQANGMLIREFALVNTEGLMITHQVRASSIGKEADIVVNGEYSLTF